MKGRWLNFDSDLYVVTELVIKQYVECAYDLEITWTEDPLNEEGCLARARVYAPFSLGGQVLARMRNGDGLELVKCCGQRGQDKYKSEDVILRLTRCAIEQKRAIELASYRPEHKAEPIILLELNGMLRFW